MEEESERVQYLIKNWSQLQLAREYDNLESNWKELKKWLEERINNANKVFLDYNEDEETKEYVLARKFMMEETLNKIHELENKDEKH